MTSAPSPHMWLTDRDSCACSGQVAKCVEQDGKLFCIIWEKGKQTIDFEMTVPVSLEVAGDTKESGSLDGGSLMTPAPLHRPKQTLHVLY